MLDTDAVDELHAVEAQGRRPLLLERDVVLAHTLACNESALEPTAGSATPGGVPSMTVFLRAFWHAAAVVVRIRAFWHADPGGIPVPRFVVLL